MECFYGTVFDGGTSHGHVFKLIGTGFMPGDDLSTASLALVGGQFG
jgi:hypothetical protein